MNPPVTEAPRKDTVKAAQKNVASSSQMHLKVAEIRDNTLTLKNGGVRAILSVSSLNLNLKSEDEQKSVIYSYQNFLNSLEFPIQVVVRSKKLELDDYLDNLIDRAKKQKNTLLQEQTKDYIDYIQRLIEYADIMQKEFYVVIPYDPIRAKQPTMLQKFFAFMKVKDTATEVTQRRREFETLRKGLAQRINIVESGLANCGVKVEQLKTEELVTLLYESYNPRTSRLQKFKKSDELAVEPDADLHKEATQDEE